MYRRQHQGWDIQIHIRSRTHTTSGHMCIAIHDRGSMGTNTKRGGDRESRRLTHLAEFDMSVEPVLVLDPGSPGLGDQVAGIGTIVEDLVFVALIFSYSLGARTYHIDDSAEQDCHTMKTNSLRLHLVMQSTLVLHNQVLEYRNTPAGLVG